jgi:hypothetical protein
MGCGYPDTPSEEERAAQRQQQINTLNYVQGQIELFAPAQEHPGGARVAPGGRWMTISNLEWSNNTLHILLVDLTNGSERECARKDYGGLRWLEDDFFLSGPYLYYAPDLTVTKLESYKGPEYIELFRGAENVYALTGSAIILVSTAPEYPYWVATGLSSPELDHALGDIPYIAVPPQGRGGGPFLTGGQAPSPDGRYYATYNCPIRKTESVGMSICIKDAATDEMVAGTYKEVRNLQFAGWAYDSSGIYFQSVPGTSAEGAYYPEMPIYKLLAPGAELQGTPAPVIRREP